MRHQVVLHPWGRGGGGTIGTTRRGAGHLGLTRTETQRGRLWTACGQRHVDSKNSQTTLATASTTSTTGRHSSTCPHTPPLGSVSMWRAARGFGGVCTVLSK